MLIGNHVIECDDYYIRELPSGVDELNFTISVYSPSYPLISEESVIMEEGIPYLVKAIDAGQNTVQIKAQIDLDAWKATVLTDYSPSGTPATIINAVKPSGWTVTDNSGITSTTKLEVVGATPLDILTSLRENVTALAYRFNPTTKVLKLEGQPSDSAAGSGPYLSRELNLRRIEYKGKSTQYATRLYATGKDGLTFASINGGKAYVDAPNAPKVVCAYMKDERYEDKSSLLAAATAQVNAMAIPQRSYTCDAVDLAKIDPARFSHLDFKLLTRIDLIDDMRDTKIPHTIVEYWRYPKRQEKNKIVLSTTTPRIQSQVPSILNSINNPNSEWQEKQDAHFDTLTVNIIKVADLNADNIKTGTLSADRIAANSISVSKLTGSIINGSWEIDLDNGTLTIGTISADKITTGQLSASVISSSTSWLTRLYCNTISAGSIIMSDSSDSAILTPEGVYDENLTLHPWTSLPT